MPITTRSPGLPLHPLAPSRRRGKAAPQGGGVPGAIPTIQSALATRAPWARRPEEPDPLRGRISQRGPRFPQVAPRASEWAREGVRSRLGGSHRPGGLGPASPEAVTKPGRMLRPRSSRSTAATRMTRRNQATRRDRTRCRRSAAPLGLRSRRTLRHDRVSRGTGEGNPSWSARRSTPAPSVSPSTSLQRVLLLPDSTAIVRQARPQGQKEVRSCY